MPDHQELEARAVSKRKCSPGAVSEGRKFTLSQQVKPGEKARKKKPLISEKWQLLISNLGNYIPRNNSQELVTNSFHQNMLFLVLGERDFACYRVWNKMLVKGFNYKVFQRDLILQLPLKGRDESRAFEKLCWWGSSKEISWIIQQHVLHLSLLTADGKRLLNTPAALTQLKDILQHFHTTLIQSHLSRWPGWSGLQSSGIQCRKFSVAI